MAKKKITDPVEREIAKHQRRIDSIRKKIEEAKGVAADRVGELESELRNETQILAALKKR